MADGSLNMAERLRQSTERVQPPAEAAPPQEGPPQLRAQSPPSASHANGLEPVLEKVNPPATLSILRKF